MKKQYIELHVEILLLSQDIVTSSIGDKFADDIWA